MTGRWTIVVALASAVAGCQGGAVPVREARITFTACPLAAGGPQHFTVCTTHDSFIAEAEQHLADGTRRIPCFDLRDGTGCDSQWSWSVDPETPVFVDISIDSYDGCPSDVEGNKPLWIGRLRRFCPWSATVEKVTIVSAQSAASNFGQ